MTTTAPTRKLKRSVAALNGRIVVLPEHPNWDEARLAWNLAVDQQPSAVVFPESAQDVIAAVELARAFELRVTAQGTGHNAAPLGPLEDTVLVKAERMRGVKIDPETRIARIDAGVRSLELVEAAAQHGLAPLAGSSPDVGVVGYTLGGGLSWFDRNHGLAASHVHAIEVGTRERPVLRVHIRRPGHTKGTRAIFRERSGCADSKRCASVASTTNYLHTCGPLRLSTRHVECL